MNNRLSTLIEIVLAKPENFLIVRETLTRIGLANKEHTKLFQTCHILCKKNKYFIVHFKEMFMLDGRSSNMSDEDLARRNSIINYLLERNFFTLKDGQTKLEPHLPAKEHTDFIIIPFTAKLNWELVPKYVIGNPDNKRVGYGTPQTAIPY